MSGTRRKDTDVRNEGKQAEVRQIGGWVSEHCGHRKEDGESMESRQPTRQGIQERSNNNHKAPGNEGHSDADAAELCAVKSVE